MDQSNYKTAYCIIYLFYINVSVKTFLPPRPGGTAYTTRPDVRGLDLTIDHICTMRSRLRAGRTNSRTIHRDNKYIERIYTVSA